MAEREIVALALLQTYTVLSSASNVMGTRFIAEENTLPVAILSTMEKLILLGGVGLLALSGDLSLITLTACYCIAGTLRTISVLALLRIKFSWLPKFSSPSSVMAALTEAWPFGATQVVQGFGSRLETPVLALHSAVWAGVYAAAMRFVEGSFFLVQSGATALLPSAVRTHRENMSEYRSLVFVASVLAAIAGLLLCGVLVIFSSQIVHATFGDSFNLSGELLRFLAFVVPIVFLNRTLSALLNGAGNERGVLSVALVAQASRLGAMAVLPAIIGMDGAPLAALTGTSIALVLHSLTMRRTLATPAASATSLAVSPS